MAELFLPLEHLLVSGGDPRLIVDAASRMNQYGCRPFPCPDMPSFSSSTATSISPRAYDHVAFSREALMQSAIAVGMEEAFDARVEAMRGELKAHLGLAQTRVDVVFSPSGTDAQLQALLLARALLGPRLTTVIVGADQTGSGTVETARGQHFSAATANGRAVTKGRPIAGLAESVSSVAVSLCHENGDRRPQAQSDASVIVAVERSIANGSNVLLQIMDSSKLGWRAPSEQCLDEIATRWPDRVQVVVDACQMRLGRPQLRKYLDRGYLVIVTGSKYFTGPAFSGALLVPAALSPVFDAATGVAPGLCEYISRSDWPLNWSGQRSRFPVRTNLGQWLRWEAALEEIGAYYRLPDEFRVTALTALRKGAEEIIAASPSLRPLPPQPRQDDGRCDDEEFAQPTIFPFAIMRDGRMLSLDDCRKIHRALARDVAPVATACLVGQPVGLGLGEPSGVAALRICTSARMVTEAWSSDPGTTIGNLQRELGRLSTVVAKIEWLAAHGGQT